MLSFSIDLPWITLHAIFNIQSNFHIKLGGTVKKKIPVSTRDNEGKILQNKWLGLTHYCKRVIGVQEIEVQLWSNT